MNRLFRISPKDKLIIEWQLINGEWGFYKVCDSLNDAKRSLTVLMGELQPVLMESE